METEEQVFVSKCLLGLQRQGDTERDCNRQTLLGSSPPTHPVHGIVI